MGQDGLYVLRAEVSAAGHQNCGRNQHSKSPQPGPVDYMMTCWLNTLNKPTEVKPHSSTQLFFFVYAQSQRYLPSEGNAFRTCTKLTGDRHRTFRAPPPERLKNITCTPQTHLLQRGRGKPWRR